MPSRQLLLLQPLYSNIMPAYDLAQWEYLE